MSHSVIDNMKVWTEWHMNGVHHYHVKLFSDDAIQYFVDNKRVESFVNCDEINYNLTTKQARVYDMLTRVYGVNPVLAICACQYGVQHGC